MNARLLLAGVIGLVAIPATFSNPRTQPSPVAETCSCADPWTEGWDRMTDCIANSGSGCSSFCATDCYAKCDRCTVTCTWGGSDTAYCKSGCENAFCYWCYCEPVAEALLVMGFDDADAYRAWRATATDAERLAANLILFATVEALH